MFVFFYCLLVTYLLRVTPPLSVSEYGSWSVVALLQVYQCTLTCVQLAVSCLLLLPSSGSVARFGSFICPQWKHSVSPRWPRPCRHPDVSAEFPSYAQLPKATVGRTRGNFVSALQVLGGLVISAVWMTAAWWNGTLWKCEWKTRRDLSWQLVCYS